MKRIYTYIMVMAGILMSSCQEDHIDSQPTSPPTVKIDASDEYYVIATSPSRIVFNISANTPWSIESDSHWCVPTPAKSAESSLVSEIVILPEDNESFQPRTATLTVSSDNGGIVKTVKVIQAKMREKVTFEVVGGDPRSNVVVAGQGMACDTTITFNSSGPWTIVGSELPSWLSLEKIDDNRLKVSTNENNNMLHERSALVKFEVRGVEETFEVPFRFVQPAPIKINENTVMSVDAVSGYTKITFTKGEMFRTNYLVRNGRMVIEFDDMKMSAVCNLGFVFIGTSTDANFKFHIEGSNTYWFRCAGAFTWIAPIKKPYTFEEVNAIRKLEFVIAPSENGLIDISIFINGVLYGTQAGRTDAFAKGEEGCVFIMDTGLEPAAGDYCVIKSITYISE